MATDTTFEDEAFLHSEAAGMMHRASLDAARLRARVGNHLRILEKMFTGNPCFAWEARWISRTIGVEREWVEQYVRRCEERILAMETRPGADISSTIEVAMGFPKRGRGNHSSVKSARIMLRDWIIYARVQVYLDRPGFNDAAAFRHVAHDLKMKVPTVKAAYNRMHKTISGLGIEEEIRAEAAFSIGHGID
jgi:hypothetical protein